jgi:hypothetical protein
MVMAEADTAVRERAFFSRLFRDPASGGMAFEVIERAASDPQAALLAATQGFVPVRPGTPDELDAALNIIAADFAVHLSAARPEEVEATLAELQRVGECWLAHVARLVADATATLRAA